MPCLKPIRAFRSLSRDTSTGRYGITFNATKALIEGTAIKLPCGQCKGCRIDRAKDWSLRCSHEAQLWKQNCFITLTFSNEHLPKNYSISVRDWQLFMKRLRKSVGGKKIRSFACGEYTPEPNLRPHYHALLFNHDFADRVLFKKSPSGNNIYTSKELEALWPFGFSTTTDLTYQSAGYVCRYSMKKITGDRAADHYIRRHPITGETHKVQPEFATQSRRPGLGAEWLAKFRGDIYPSDFIIMDGKKHRVPRFYTDRLSEEEIERVKRTRKRQSLKHRDNNTPERLAVRETVLSLKLDRLKRDQL